LILVSVTIRDGFSPAASSLSRFFMDIAVVAAVIALPIFLDRRLD
jgi:hypothetical protein